MSNPTLTWERLDSKFYRNFEGYDLQWYVDLDEYEVASAQYGGAIALAKKQDRIRTRTADQRVAPLKIYSGAGREIRELPWDGGRIAGIGMTTDEELLVVSENGTARDYYDFEGGFRQLTMGQAAEDAGVRACQFHGDELVAQLGDGEFVALVRHGHGGEGVFRPLAKVPVIAGGAQVDGWAVAPADADVGRSLEVIISVGGQLVVLGQYEAVTDRYEDVALASQTNGSSNGPKKSGSGAGKPNGAAAGSESFGPSFPVLSVSPSGSWIGGWRSDGRAVAFERDGGGRIISEPYDERPAQIAWCGDDALVLVSEDHTATLLDLELGKSLSVYFDSRVVVLSEVDGMRTLTSERHDFFARVPQRAVDIFRLGSTAPAAILLDSVEQLERKSPKADENLLLIADELSLAVDACVEAAGHEFSPRVQKMLLRAAAFGKAAVPLYNSDRFVRMSDALRVLNAVRSPDVGMLVSYPQFSTRLGPHALVGRLLKRRMHALAAEAGTVLDVPGARERVLVDWARAKIRLSPADDDASLFRAIMVKTSSHSGVEYDQIAATAHEEGRPDLAVVLINEEPRADRQIPLLLSMNEHELAIAEAARASDPALVYYVLLVLARKLPRAAFFRLINDQPLASRCYVRLCRALDVPGFSEDDFYYQDDRRADIAKRYYARLVASPPATDGELVSELADARALFRQAKTLEFEEHAVQEQQKLAKVHADLEKDYGQPFRGKTVAETIAALLAMSATSRATKVKDDFKVSDAKFWWLRIHALVARRDWDGLHKLASSKKSPIGYEPFFHEALRAGNKQNAALYVAYCTNLPTQRRLEMYVEVGDLRRAIDDARKHKDIAGLNWLKQHATEAQQMDIESIISTLRK